MSVRDVMGAWGRDGWVRPFVERYKRALAVAVALGSAAAVFSVALMFTSGYLISASAEQPDSIFQLMVPLAFVQIFGVGRPFLTYFARLADHDWVLRATSGLRKRLFESLALESRAGAARRRTGEMLGLLAEDVEHMQDLFVRCALPAIAVWVTCLVATFAFGVFSPLFALVMLVVFVVTALLVPLVSALVDAGRRMRAQACAKAAFASVTDDVMGLCDWVCAGRRDDFVRRVDEAAASARTQREASRSFSHRRDLAVQALFLATSLVVTAWAAARFGGQVAGPANLIAAFVIAFFPLAELVAPLGDAGSDARVYMRAIEDLNELTPPERDVCVTDGALLGERPSIVLASVCFAYPDEGEANEVVSNVDLVVPYGQKVCVLGASGAGKSTLLSLVHGDLQPTSGTVELGGVATFALAGEQRRWFGVIQQNPYVFDDTLVANVRVGRADVGADEAADVLERVGLGELVRSLPQGLNTRVGENGANLSGGQRQRLALARVLVQGAPIVLLDEPFCSLDPVTEALVLDTVLDTLADKTVVLVTHHLCGVSRMDRVVFVEGGTVALDGAPAELERTSERYRQLLSFDLGR